MKVVLFASSNKSKIEQFQYVADSFGIQAKIVSVYDEYQAIRPYSEEYETHYEIIENGAREIYSQTKHPVVVEDTILEVDALDGLPGLRASNYLKIKGVQGLLNELHDITNRAARITSIVGYYDGKLFVSTKNVIEGQIAGELSYLEGEPTWIGPTYHPYGGGFNPVFISAASGKTLADHSAKEGLEFGYREPNFKLMLDILK